MKKLRIFLVVISLMTFTTAFACGPDYGYYYETRFIMRTPILDAIDNDNKARKSSEAETLDFWYKYTGGAINRDTLANAIENLDYETFLNNKEKDNALTAYLLHRQDKTALTYLRYNSELTYGAESYGWDYHEPYTYDQWNTLYVNIGKLPAEGKFADRIQYMKVRCMFKMNKYNDIIMLWKTKLHKMKNAALRNRIEGYVGGSYFWTKRYNEAVDIFQKLGDIQSINSVVNKMLSTTSKEAIYANDPNSLALEYAMQDYANIYYHCITNKRLAVEEPEYFCFDMEQGGVWDTVTREYNQTIAFAKKVLADRKTKTPMFWAGFIGFMEWVHGDADDAYQWLEKAQKMKGDSQMAYCVRLYKFLAALNMAKKPGGFDDYFLTEYRFFLANAKNRNKIGAMEISAIEEMAALVFETELTQEAIDYYAPNGGLTKALLLTLNSEGEWYSYFLDKENTADKLIQMFQQFKAGGNGKVESTLVKMAEGNVLFDDMFNDFIGTKLLREMRFDEAQKYLSLVPLEYLNKQGIAAYLAQRTMPKTPFQRKQYAECWNEDLGGKPLTTNVKLQFARDMASRQAKIKLLIGDAKAEEEYDLANYLFQASSLGDLWAMTEYTWGADDYNSELIPHIVALLKDAEVNARTLHVINKACYGLVAIPSGEKYISWNGSNWDFSNMTTWQSQALYQLSASIKTSDPMYLSCDVLRCYMQCYHFE